VRGLVIDASVAIKWLVPEAGSAAARALVEDGTELVIPDLLLIEVANVLWKLTRLRQIAATDASNLMGLLSKAVHRIEPSVPLLPRALALSLSIDHTVYDCVYLALAEREQLPVVTDDRRLVSAGGKLAGVAVQALRP
jgi:predicted nucleic acid-binding protein